MDGWSAYPYRETTTILDKGAVAGSIGGINN